MEASGTPDVPFVDKATFNGYLSSVEDAMLLVEASNLGIVQRLNRRLQSDEQGSIRSGAIFVFDENETNMKRWTDKLMWSPSRQIGSFFVYRQMTTKIPRGTSIKNIMAISLAARGGIELPYVDPAIQASEREYVGSLVSGPQYAREGLVKKTIAIGYVHVVSYFKLDDVQSGNLSTPSSLPIFQNLKVSKELRQSFAASAPHSPTPSEEHEEGHSPEAPLHSPTYSLYPAHHKPATVWSLQPAESNRSDSSGHKPTRANSVPGLHAYGWSPYHTSASSSSIPTTHGSIMPALGGQPVPLAPMGPLQLQPVPRSLDAPRRSSAYDLRAAAQQTDTQVLPQQRVRYSPYPGAQSPQSYNQQPLPSAQQQYYSSAYSASASTSIFRPYTEPTQSQQPQHQQLMQPAGAVAHSPSYQYVLPHQSQLVMPTPCNPTPPLFVQTSHMVPSDPAVYAASPYEHQRPYGQQRMPPQQVNPYFVVTEEVPGSECHGGHITEYESQ